MTDEEKLAAEAKAAEAKVAEAKAAEEAAAKVAAEAAASASGGTQASEGLSQEQVDAILKRRLASERKKWEEETATAAKQAEMTEAEKAKANLEAEKKAHGETTAKAQLHILLTEAKVAALAEGATAERVTHIVRLLDLSGVEFDGDEPDLKALSDAVAQVKKDLPELFGVPASTQRSGGDFGKGKESKRVYAQSEYAELCKDAAYFEEHREELLAATHEKRVIFGK